MTWKMWKIKQKRFKKNGTENSFSGVILKKVILFEATWRTWTPRLVFFRKRIAVSVSLFNAFLLTRICWVLRFCFQFFVLKKDVWKCFMVVFFWFFCGISPTIHILVVSHKRPVHVLRRRAWRSTNFQGLSCLVDVAGRVWYIYQNWPMIYDPLMYSYIPYMDCSWYTMDWDLDVFDAYFIHIFFGFGHSFCLSPARLVPVQKGELFHPGSASVSEVGKRFQSGSPSPKSCRPTISRGGWGEFSKWRRWLQECHVICSNIPTIQCHSKRHTAICLLNVFVWFHCVGFACVLRCG